MTALLDDHLLLATLLAEDDEGPVPGPLATTGLWYHRLSRALLASPVAGALSHRLGGLDETVAARVIEAATRLPDEIVLVSLRDLAGPMARLLADGIRLNLLSLEALAAAEHLGATIHLSAADHNPTLQEAADRRGVPLEVVGV